MAKFIKSNRVAIITRGRQAGQKVVIVTPFDEGTKSHPFGHALVVGTERASRRRAQSKTVKPFIKRVNYNHLMPTRYTFGAEGLQNIIGENVLDEPSARDDAKKELKKIFEDQKQAGHNPWFFTVLNF